MSKAGQLADIETVIETITPYAKTLLDDADASAARATLGASSISKLLHIQDQKASGTNGGDALAGDNIRVLNTVVTNEITGASLASNQITLPVGDYYIDARAGARIVDRHKVFLYNTTDTVAELAGSAEYIAATSASATTSFVAGRFSIASTKVFELRHYIETAYAGTGFGVGSASGETEVYADVKIWTVG